MTKKHTLTNGQKNLKILLAGYERSKRILPITSYLLDKYVPKEFDIYFLNFGLYTDKLFCGTYVSLANEQWGGATSWSSYIYDYISQLEDDLVILGVDDHLINSPVNMKVFKRLKELVRGDIKSARLCDSNWYPKEKVDIENGIITLKQTADYLVTGQYTIWDREALLKILEPERSVWEFEIEGSSQYQAKKWKTIAAVECPFKYYDVSALRVSRPNIDLTGVKEEDIEYLKTNGYLNAK